eukprot:TRINITY_DN47558_c0_g1_i1.p1 TRINITY_DN47558_c0_g1~~TRINITY_DN47558_c0_g1_i1.p1  ORF type:complete len:468 (+),score=127.70 TRINITY_DN47558_c0_g1_i1:86-1405(+)
MAAGAPGPLPGGGGPPGLTAEALDAISEGMMRAREEEARRRREDPRPREVQLREMFEQRYRPEVLSLSYADLENDGAELLLEWLRSRPEADPQGRLPQLAEIDLGGNRVTNAERLGAVLSLCPGLTEVDLRDNVVGKHGVYALQSPLLKLGKLCSLSLNECLVSDYGAETIANVCRQKPTLTKLDLVNNRLTAAAAEHFAAELSRADCRLSYLSLDYNRLGDGGAAVLAKALCKNTSLTVLGISDNAIGDDGAARLAEWLAASRGTVRNLDLSVNNIGTKGYAALGQALARNRVLLSLDLGGQQPPCGDEAVFAVLRGLEGKPTLRKLDLTNSGLSGDSGAELLRLLRANSSLVAMPLYVNEGLPAECHEQVAQHIAENLSRCMPDQGAEQPAAAASSGSAKRPWRASSGAAWGALALIGVLLAATWYLVMPPPGLGAP